MGHVVPDEKQVERVEHQGRDDQGPNRIVHAEIEVDQVPGNQARVKHHRNEKEQSEPVAVTDMLGGQRISGHGCNGDRKDRTDHRHEDRDHVTPVQRRAAEQEQLVCIQRQLGRKQLVTELLNAGFVGKGHHEHKQHGQDAENGDDADQCCIHGVEKFRSGRHLSLAPFRMVPARFRTRRGPDSLFSRFYCFPIRE